MVWKQDMDKVLLQEMVAEGVLHHKPKSRNRGISWQRVVDKVNALPNFEVNVKSVRDRFKLLAKKHKVKMGKQERSTGGGSVDLSELEILLEDLTEIEDDTNQRAEEECREKKISEDEDRVKALEMRKRAMESIGETRERLGKTSSEERKRRSAKKSMEFLEKAIEKKQKMQEEEKKAREEERQEQHAVLRQLEANIQQQTAQYTMTEKHLLQNLTMQQQQQQQQMHQFAAMQNNMMALMEQQRQQSEMIMELIKNTTK
jgi:myosin heavy subunit